MDKLLMTDYLDQTAGHLPDKAAFCSENDILTFGQLRDKAKSIGTALAKQGYFKQPVAIKIDKSPNCIAAMMGVAYAGCFYTIIDVHMPQARADRIMKTLEPVAVIDETNFGQLTSGPTDDELLAEVRERILETDIFYVLFTSGSTGNPKGVVIPHRAVTAYLEWGGSVFKLDDTAIYANQAPFYFILSGFEIFHTIRGGGTTWIVPEELYSFPVRLLEYLKEKRVNTIYWVPSAFCLVANFRALPEVHLPDLRLVFFGGEVMPVKQLNMWMDEYPDADFVNLYGPTEMTDISTYYIVKRRHENDEPLPIGIPAGHMDFLILNEYDRPAGPDEEGELCGRGPSLAYGYYNNPQATDEVFVQNPLNTSYPEKIYRSGDLVKWNDRGELIFIGRKDFQIKHMGHRIELGEIETAVSSVDGVDENACFYDSGKSRIICYYTGETEQNVLGEKLKNLIPDYMLPAKRVHLDVMPKNLNGKIDRKTLKESI